MSLVESPSSSSSNNHDFFQRDTTSQSPESSSNSGGKISPAILFIIIILAVIFFISGLLHLLVRFFIRKRSSSSSSFSQSNRYPDNISTSEGIQRQLQNLFHLHDSGLDQAFIDALPVFQYKEIVGLKEPFDCAVCLCEFSEQDKLRLLPLCSHAFHIDCIDTWLLSNSTCPLCRGALYTPGLAIENPVFDFDESREDDSGGGGGGDCNGHHKGVEIEIVSEKSKRVFPVRLGKFKSSSNSNINNSEVVHEQVLQRDVGETSSSNLDARRCFSMGSYQYVVADSVMQVALCPNRPSNGGAESKIIKGRGGQNGNFTCNIRDDGDDVEARKINNIGTKNESLSVSKIWLWSKKGKFPNSTNATDFSSGFPVDMNLPWTNRGQAT